MVLIPLIGNRSRLFIHGLKGEAMSKTSLSVVNGTYKRTRNPYTNEENRDITCVNLSVGRKRAA